MLRLTLLALALGLATAGQNTLRGTVVAPTRKTKSDKCGDLIKAPSKVGLPCCQSVKLADGKKCGDYYELQVLSSFAKKACTAEKKKNNECDEHGGARPCKERVGGKGSSPCDEDKSATCKAPTAPASTGKTAANEDDTAPKGSAKAPAAKPATNEGDTAPKGKSKVQDMVKAIDAGKAGTAETKQIAKDLGTGENDDAPKGKAKPPPASKVQQMANAIDAGKAGTTETKQIAKDLGTGSECGDRTKAPKKQKKVGKRTFNLPTCQSVKLEAGKTCGDFFEYQILSSVEAKDETKKHGPARPCKVREGGKGSSPCDEDKVTKCK